MDHVTRIIELRTEAKKYYLQAAIAEDEWSRAEGSHRLRLAQDLERRMAVDPGRPDENPGSTAILLNHQASNGVSR